MGTESKELDPKAADLQLVAFSTGREKFDINVLDVWEVTEPVHIVEVPGAPDFVEGTIRLHSMDIPVINLHRQFEAEEKALGRHARIITAEIEGNTIGFKVDTFNRVLKISSRTHTAPPSASNRVNTEFFESIAKLKDKTLVLINLPMQPPFWEDEPHRPLGSWR